MRQIAKLGAGSARPRLRAGIATLAVLLATGAARAAEPASPSPTPTAAPDRQPTEADKAGEVPVPAPPPGASLPPVDTIIPDQEFNAAIPSLDAADDPELAQPLESIEAFERRIAEQQAVAKPGEGQAPPAGQPALSDQTEREVIGDAPIRDAELARPLPPLEAFQVEPVQLGEPEKDEADTEVRYAFRVNGLPAADEETATDLSGEFRRLSALRGGDGKASNAAMVAARVTEDSALIKRLLASEGWYDAEVRTRVERAEGEDKTARLSAVLDVVPGRRYVLSEIVIQAAPTVPPDLIGRNLALNRGEPIIAQRVQGAEAQVALALPQNGYPFATVGQRDILLDPDKGDGVYTLPINVGARARFGGFATRGDLAFDADHVAVLARFRRGELYDSRKVDDLRQALVATGLFSTIAVDPQPSGDSAPDDTEYVTMMVDQDAGPPRTVAGTVGYGSGEGFRAEASWTHRNFFPPEGALIVRGVAGTKEQAAGVTFRRSNAGKRDRTFEIVAEASHSTYDAYTAYTGRLAARMSRDSTPIWQKKFTWALGAQLIGTVEKDFDFAANQRASRTYYIAGLTGQFGVDFSNSLLDPTKGFRVTTLIEPEGSVADGFTPYVRARVDVSGYYPVSDGLVLAGRARLGTIQGASLLALAPSRRFYAGGGGSVRGFAYQKLGPLDPLGDPLGGRSLNEAAAEVRYRFGNYGVVGFIDAGQAYSSTTPQFSDLRHGVGIGGRFYTNFGPVRLDVATPLARRTGEGRFNVYVSIGQAF